MDKNTEALVAATLAAAIINRTTGPLGSTTTEASKAAYAFEQVLIKLRERNSFESPES